MKTIRLEQPNHFSLIDTQAPTEWDTHHTLVRVRRVGICGTDYHAFKGVQPFFSYPRILGHELAVEVVQPDPHSTLTVGTFARCALTCTVGIAWRVGVGSPTLAPRCR
jgi:threonine dehydrogenase-like Zn-dependent dehydrogenase